MKDVYIFKHTNRGDEAMAIHFNTDKDPYADFLKAKKEAQQKAGQAERSYNAEKSKQKNKKTRSQGAKGNEGAATPKSKPKQPIKMTGYKEPDFGPHQGIQTNNGTYHPL